MTGISRAVAARLPSKDSLKHIVRYNRQVNNAVPAIPTDLESLEIPKEYQFIGDKLFLLGDSFDKRFEFEDHAGILHIAFLYIIARLDLPRILIFGKASNSEWSGQMKHIFVDGTFRQAPPMFFQIYAILAARTTSTGKSFVFPVMYALLPNKRQKTYMILFEMIKQVAVF
ncbi:MAG: hypothetical protein DI539_28765 [Flavobacterium psychrophilum]|nr:MAG: hypothetical protein DI539_28765 [Flavobacterium psychrophilum]